MLGGSRRTEANKEYMWIKYDIKSTNCSRLECYKEKCLYTYPWTMVYILPMYDEAECFLELFHRMLELN